MSSLFDNVGYLYRRSPHNQAEYLGALQWRIMDTTFTDVDTVGDGTPTVGRSYPAFCNDPDNWRGWVVVVNSEHRIQPFEVAVPNFYTYWLQVGASETASFFLGELDKDDNPGIYTGMPTPEEERVSAKHVRSQGSVLWWTDGSNLHSRDDANVGATTTTDMGGEIQTMSVSEAGQTAGIVDVEAGGPTEQEAYDAGFLEGISDPQLFAFSTGAFDCQEGNGYEPDFAYDNEPTYPPTPPPPYNSPAAVVTAWQNGHRDGYRIAYRDGYESEGCVVEE